MDRPSDNVASALRIAGVLSAQLKIGLTAIKDAKNLTQACGCGKMAEGFGKPCLQPVCAACSRDECPPCPHKHCKVNGLKGFRGETSNGAVLFDAVNEHIDHISELLDHLIVLTKDM
ncbi:hypothetical protein GGG16DRAFT_128765 [Schizophyllum commune]